ncbi:hypothetical protein evm_010926 [Chilo suppressalis]|nr:hypothetical protein evm_010926 [Chilo suppressalis]
MCYCRYNVNCDHEEINSLIKMMNDLAELPYHNVRGSTAHLLIAPELVAIFEEAVRLLKLKAIVEVDDYSEIIRLEKSGDRADKGFSWTAYYDVDAVRININLY